jgi:selT/selW/selH-like putative selenoprotein
MQRNFLQLKQFLETKFPELRGKILGENYPPPPHAILLSNVVSGVQVFAMVTMLVGDGIWSYVPFMNGTPPSWYYGVKANPVPALIGMFIIIPTMASSLITTGAFEVELDGKVIFSKIQMGRFPTGTEIVATLTKAGLTTVSY